MHKSSYTQLNTKELGTIMGIWAHPDDETFTMAGIMYECVQNGSDVVCITATYGEAGVQDESRWPSQLLASIRTHELTKALQILGVANHHWLGYPDGGCADIPEQQAIERLAELMQQYKPNSIFTFGPDGLTGHDDHMVVSKWTSAALDYTGLQADVYHAVLTKDQHDHMQVLHQKLNIFFNTQNPPVARDCDCDICFCLPDECLSRKLEALQAMPSQTEKMLQHFGDILPQALGVEAFQKAKHTGSTHSV